MLQDKPHPWIEARVKCLDPGDYLEEVQSLRYFGRNARDFAMGIIAIADWGRIFKQRSQVSHSDLPTVLIHAFARVMQIGGTGTIETISVRRPQRGCLPPLPGVLEVASYSAAVLDR